MFKVNWKESATREFLRAAADQDSQIRRKLLAAVGDVEQLLSNDPLNTGESREPGERVIVTRLLTISFQVNVRFKEVLIVAVRVRASRK